MTEDDRTREDNGTYGDEVPDNIYLKLVNQRGIATTSDIKQDLQTEYGVKHHRNTVRERLKKLADKDEIKKKESGRQFLWMNRETWEATGQKRTSIKEAIKELLDYLGIATTPVILTEISEDLDIEQETVLDVLYELEENNTVKSESADDKEIWMLKE